jgi:RHS repeat-associated protein
LPGQYYDAETRLHYNQQRYYDPETGQYLSTDPLSIAGGHELYNYAQQNPTSYVDPEGQLPLLAVIPYIITGVSVGATGYEVYDTVDGLASGSVTKEDLAAGYLQDKAIAIGLKALPGIGATAGIAYGYLNKSPVGQVAGNSAPAFTNETKLIQHFEKHGTEFRVNSADDYLNVGQDIIQNGHQIKYLYNDEIRTGYISYMRNNQRSGESLFGFVGVNPEGAIATIHTKSRTDIFKLMGDTEQSQLKIFRTDTIGPKPQQGWVFPYKSN